MFSSNLTKFFAVFGLVLLLFSGCRFWQKKENANTSPTPAVSDDLKTEIPFPTKEPERFQAEIVVTSGGAERVTFIARDGANQRYDFNFGAKDQLTKLQTDKNYLILPDKKIYAENAPSPIGGSDDWTDFLTTEWLSQKHPANFEKLETSENTTKYRVSTGDGAASEVLIYVDETLGFPVKQEFYSGEGERKNLTLAFELRNLKLQTDAGLFAIPSDFKKVPVEEFRKNLRGREE